mmetsp:Transcript_10273/g.16781  ORF Transcript_10273/g.16781 Transcript_10273/m.16781 type:complete len:208 (+) Transcript_10273:454-1077(+)
MVKLLLDPNFLCTCPILYVVPMRITRVDIITVVVRPCPYRHTCRSGYTLWHLINSYVTCQLNVPPGFSRLASNIIPRLPMQRNLFLANLRCTIPTQRTTWIPIILLPARLDITSCLPMRLPFQLGIHGLKKLLDQVVLASITHSLHVRALGAFILLVRHRLRGAWSRVLLPFLAEATTWTVHFREFLSNVPTILDLPKINYLFDVRK